MPSENLILPSDATPEEVEFFEYSICNLYKSLPRREDMFLVAFVHELGYKKTIAAEILGVSPSTITVRLKQIKKQLKEEYVKKRMMK